MIFWLSSARRWIISAVCCTPLDSPAIDCCTRLTTSWPLPARVSAGLRQVAGGAGVLGDVIDRGGHFIDRRGGLIGFALLAEHAVAHLVHARRQPCSADVQLPGGAGDGVDHPLITGLHAR